MGTKKMTFLNETTTAKVHEITFSFLGILLLNKIYYFLSIDTAFIHLNSIFVSTQRINEIWLSFFYKLCNFVLK